MQNNNSYKRVFTLLAVGLAITTLLSIKFGAIDILLKDIFSSIDNVVKGNDLTLTERIFIEIRLPRALACLFIGASLSLSGVLMQALFRNPIVEPGLIGTSSGAAFGASLYFVLGATVGFHAGQWTLPLSACIGGTLSTLLVFYLSRSTSGGKRSITALLLIGIAVNALCLSGVGLMSYLARDPQARSITFWNLGTLSGSNWQSVIIIGGATLICIFFALTQSKKLNALMMGEDEAQHLGVDIKKLQLVVVGINVVLIGIATSFVGVISFVGLVVPHLLRLLKGSDTRYLLIGSTLLGGIFLSLADLAARLLLAPAELPIGIVTSVIGAPVFIYLLSKNQYYF